MELKEMDPMWGQNFYKNWYLPDGWDAHYYIEVFDTNTFTVWHQTFDRTGGVTRETEIGVAASLPAAMKKAEQHKKEHNPS